MGLLDDAIREHLELKRRRGADPGEVAREQHEALVPAHPGEPSRAGGDFESGSQDGAAEPEGVEPAGVAGGDAALIDEPAMDAPSDPTAQDATADSRPSAVGQETVEIDMQSVLEEDPEGTESAAAEEDSLEWEMPESGAGRGDGTVEGTRAAAGRSGERRDGDDSQHHHEELSDVPRPLPGQERLSFE
jgi:hypothetical protein